MDYIQPTRKTAFSDFGAGLTKVLQAVRAVCETESLISGSRCDPDVVQKRPGRV